MTFASIVFKNLKYNFTNFLSYILVNVFVIAVVFMYGSIIFNEHILNDPLLSGTMDFVNMGIIAMVLFSIVFISFTGIYFIKRRGRELGVYLTLGMDKKELLKMILIENTAIMLVSVIGGIIVGYIFSGLFYLILGNVLDTQNLFYIDVKAVLLSLGVFFIVFIANVIFSTLFIKGTSIVNITKANNTKGMSSPKKATGFIGIALFILSTIMLYLVFTDNDIVSGLSKWMTEVIYINVTIQFISLYLLISSGLSFLVGVLSSNKKFYHHNILTLSNVKYTFYSYKNTMYMVTLLVGMSIFFMGVPLSFKVATEKNIDDYLPYDLMVESRGDINNIDQNELKKIVIENDGVIRESITFPYITTEIYRENATWLYHYGVTTMIISESNFNKAFGTQIDVSKEELLLVSNDKAMFKDKSVDYDTFLVIDNWKDGHERAQQVRFERPTRESFLNSVRNDGVQTLTYEKKNTKTMVYPFINSYGELEFASVLANVIDDEVYNRIVNPEITNVHLMNLESGNTLNIYHAIKDNLRNLNGDETLWRTSNTFHEGKTTPEEFNPISKLVQKETTFKLIGMMTFTMIFISILFLISSSVVIYYKLVNDIEHEKEQITLFKKIGITREECKKYLSNHSMIIFFMPLILGGGLGLLYTYFFFFNAPDRNGLLLIVLFMYVGFIVFDILYYLIVRKSLIKNVKL